MYERFHLPGHSGFLNDVSVTLTDKTDHKNPTKREDYCIHTLKTKAPLGLSVEDGLQAKLIVFCFTDYVYGRTVLGQCFLGHYFLSFIVSVVIVAVLGLLLPFLVSLFY